MSSEVYLHRKTSPYYDWQSGLPSIGEESCKKVTVPDQDYPINLHEAALSISRSVKLNTVAMKQDAENWNNIE